MNRKTKILFIVIIVLIVFLVYWAGITSPNKEVILKKEWSENIYTHEIRPIYEVYYKWDGKEQKNPWWMIIKVVKPHGEWKVIELKDTDRIKSLEDIHKYSAKFDYEWIDNYKFTPQATRYQMILLLLTFQPTFYEEKKIFYKILDEIKILEK